MYAAAQGLIEIMEFLLDNGAALEDKNYQGYTALTYASYTGQEESCRYLVNRRGANVFAQTKDGKRPEDLADTLAIKQFLQQAVVSNESKSIGVRSSGESMSPSRQSWK